MSESQTPIYDQTVTDQGWDPLDPNPYIATKREGNTYEVSPEVAAQIKSGNIGGYSIRNGGKGFGRRK